MMKRGDDTSTSRARSVAPLRRVAVKAKESAQISRRQVRRSIYISFNSRIAISDSAMNREIIALASRLGGIAASLQ
jgi:hypothetical protein